MVSLLLYFIINGW